MEIRKTITDYIQVEFYKLKSDGEKHHREHLESK